MELLYQNGFVQYEFGKEQYKIVNLNNANQCSIFVVEESVRNFPVKLMHFHRKSPNANSIP